jgi:hypothetical protein
MTKPLPPEIRAMLADVRRERRVWRVKLRVLNILRRLPDLESRRRAMAAVACLLGYEIHFRPRQ